MNADSIQYVLEELGSPKVKNLGKNVMASCPLAPWNHGSGQDSSMKLGVKVQDGISPANCFYPGCFHGTLMDLVDAVSAKKVAAGEWEVGGEQVSNLKAFILLAEDEDEVTFARGAQVVLPIPPEVMARVGSLSPYWETRGISLQTQGLWKLGEGHGRPMIPLIAKDGTVLAVKGRLLPGLIADEFVSPNPEVQSQKYRVWPPGADTAKLLVGEHLLTKPVDFLVVVESEVDAILLNEWFTTQPSKEAFPYGTATEGALAVATGGGNFSPTHVQKIVDALSMQGEVAVGFDGDHAGRLAQRRMVEALRKRLRRITEIEWERKDPSDDDGGKVPLAQVQQAALTALQTREDWFVRRMTHILTRRQYR